jgi:hypothetical protein
MTVVELVVALSPDGLTVLAVDVDVPPTILPLTVTVILTTKRREAEAPN